MNFEFSAEAISWRGPAPFVFVPVPLELSDEIKAISNRVTYGWGVVPVLATIGDTSFSTSLFPRNGVYLVPVKSAVQKAESVSIGDTLNVRIEIAMR